MIVSWLIVSVVFYLYLHDVASYQSVFGSLAAAIVVMAYLYLSTTVFLFGTQLDAIIRTQATGCAAGLGPRATTTATEPPRSSSQSRLRALQRRGQSADGPSGR